LKQGFQQVELKAGHTRDMCTFTEPDNARYSYKVCPFGHANSMYALNNVLNIEFGGLCAKGHLSIFVDDLLQFHDNWSDHIKDIEALLKQTAEANLTFNPLKTQFAASEISYLGYRLGKNTISIDPDRIKTVKDLVAPKDKKGVMRLCGFLQYWRKFIPQFAIKSYHIRQNLLKDKPFKWGKDEQDELDYFKEALTNPPVLANPQMDRDFHLITVLIRGAGFILCQLHDTDGKVNKQVLKPIAFGAKALKKSMESWSSSDLELFAVAFVLKSHENLLFGSKINVWSDNIGVVYLNKLSMGTNRHKRMLAFISQFNLSLRYLKGSLNGAADYLSRLDWTKPPTPIKFDKNFDDDFVFAIRTSSPSDQSMLVDASDIDVDGLRQYENIHSPAIWTQRVTAAAASRDM